jgi:group I intron endonuclease
MIFTPKVTFGLPVYNLNTAESSVSKGNHFTPLSGAHSPRKIRMYGKSQTKKILRSSGVYQIRCLITGQIYIGSAVNMPARWAHHRQSLQRATHRNQHLQEAWNKYGEENFEFTVVEYVKRAFLLRIEQEWIDKSQCTDRKIGFNIYPVAGSPGELNAQLWEGFIDPEGKEITIFNLHEFCRQRELDFPSMHRLAMGKSKLKSYKGWTNKNSLRKRDYVKTYIGFIDPEGRPVGPITNLAAFCREHGLDKTHMVAVAHGRICSHRGWTHKDGRQKLEPKVYSGFINPDGRRVIIANLKSFCREYGLHPVRMHQLKNGQRKSHKGWTWREDGD